MTSWNGNIFRVTGLLCGKYTGDQWIPLTKASDAELWFFTLICAPTNHWADSRDARDLRRHRAHYDVTVMLTHWGPVTHICVGKLTIIGSDNGLSPGRRQAIILISVGILLIGHLGADFSEIAIGIQIFAFKTMPLKMSSAKCCPCCLGLNVLKLKRRRYSTL